MKTGLISAFERLDSARKHDPSLGVEMLLRLGGGIAIDDLVVLLGDALLLSAFALHLAVEVATAGRRACFFTCGRPLGATAELVLGMRSGVSLAAHRRGALTTDDYSRLVVAAGDLEKLALSLDDARSPSLSQVRERAAALKLVGPEPLALIIVDGFELLSIPAACSHASKEATYTTQLWELKALADELECPVMVTAQSVASWGREGPSEAASDVFLPADMVLEVDCEADEVGGPARARLGKVRCIALRECDGRRVNVTVIRDPVGKGGQLQLCQQAKGGRMLEFRAEEKARKRTPRRRPSAQQRLEGVE